MKTYSRKKGDSPSNVIIHVNELCRLCLAKEEEMVPIYDDETVPMPLRILSCVNIEVGRGEERKEKATREFHDANHRREKHVVVVTVDVVTVVGTIDSHRAIIISGRRSRSLKNRNLVYLSAHGVLSHIISPLRRVCGVYMTRTLSCAAHDTVVRLQLRHMHVARARANDVVRAIDAARGRGFASTGFTELSTNLCDTIDSGTPFTRATTSLQRPRTGMAQALLFTLRIYRDL